MYRTAAEDLNPALALAEPAALAAALEAADIHLGAGLGEREVMRAELNLGFRSEHLLCKLCQGSLQVCEGDVLIHHKSLDLMEGRGMGGIHFVGAEYAARRNDADRGLGLLHDADLHAGGLAAQKDILVDIEGILLISCRMSLRNIQSLEIVDVILYFRTIDYFIAHARENPLQLFSGNGIRMAVADDISLCRQGDIDGLPLQLCFSGLCRQNRLGLLQPVFNELSRIIDHLADLRTIFRCHVLHASENGGQLALLSEIRYADIIQLLKRIRGTNGLHGLFFDSFQLFLHKLLLTMFPTVNLLPGEHKKSPLQLALQGTGLQSRGTTPVSASGGHSSYT